MASSTYTKCKQFLSTLGADPKLSTLLKNIKNGPHIECRPCSTQGPEGGARAALFDDTPINIVLCTNRLQENEFKEALIHELVHAYDYTNDRCDFGKCDGLAYTEIRAAREAECSRSFTFEWMREACIKDHATASTENLYSNASQCINRVYTNAMQDNAPFDGIQLYGPVPKPK